MRNGRVRDLQLATQARHREAELLTILRHGATGDGIASGSKELGELLIGERLTLVLTCDQLGKSFADLTGGDTLAFVIEDALAIEQLQHISSLVGLHGLAIAHT